VAFTRFSTPPVMLRGCDVMILSLLPRFRDGNREKWRTLSRQCTGESRMGYGNRQERFWHAGVKYAVEEFAHLKLWRGAPGFRDQSIPTRMSLLRCEGEGEEEDKTI